MASDLEDYMQFVASCDEAGRHSAEMRKASETSWSEGREDGQEDGERECFKHVFRSFLDSLDEGTLTVFSNSLLEAIDGWCEEKSAVWCGRGHFQDFLNVLFHIVGTPPEGWGCKCCHSLIDSLLNSISRLWHIQSLLIMIRTRLADAHGPEWGALNGLDAAITARWTYKRRDVVE